MPSFFYSLRIRLLLLVAICILPALGLALYTGLAQRKMAEGNAKQLALQLARETARRYEFLVARSGEFLQDFVQHPEIRGDAAAGTTLCMNLLKSHPEYNNLGVAGIDGVVRLPSWLAITTGSPPCMTATQEFVVPKSIPIIFPMIQYPPCES